jgi:acetoin utilization protein AcuB
MQHTTFVREWMTANPLTVPPDQTLIEAYLLMQQHGIRRLPIVDASGLLCGIVTRSDIERVMPLALPGNEQTTALYSLAGVTVNEIMTRNVQSVTPNETLQQVAGRMLSAKVSGLPVISDGRVIGIITESDIFRLVVASWGDH